MSRVMLMALAFGRVADEAFVFSENLEERGDGGIFGMGFVGLGDDVVSLTTASPSHRICAFPLRRVSDSVMSVFIVALFFRFTIQVYY